MLDPAPTTKIADNLARGKVLAFRESTGPKPAYVVLGFPNTNYQTFLEPGSDPELLRSKLNHKVIGTVHMSARKVTNSGAGGRFVDPYAGVPRRVQGTVVAVDAALNRLVVNAAVPVHLTLTAPGQQATDFAVGDFVGCDVLSGSSFVLIDG